MEKPGAEEPSRVCFDSLEAILLDGPSWRRRTTHATSAGLQLERQSHVTQEKTDISEGDNLDEETITPFIWIPPNQRVIKTNMDSIKHPSPQSENI